MLSREVEFGLSLMNRFSIVGSNGEGRMTKTAWCSQTQFLFHLGSYMESFSLTFLQFWMQYNWVSDIGVGEKRCILLLGVAHKNIPRTMLHILRPSSWLQCPMVWDTKEKINLDLKTLCGTKAILQPGTFTWDYQPEWLMIFYCLKPLMYILLLKLA